ncbi:unnamed protein product [Clonostachys rosea]|uniref:Uncharacterized protein n=1 Tax=Bionectria ochroleuca TaxID=29856 RepID=A0ABY6UY32_BIOOC|nr:unnamed protein product [Clonostachys rosea]
MNEKYPADQRVDAGHLGSGQVDSSVNARQSLPLRKEAVVDSVRLAQHAVYDAVAVVDAPALVRHVVRLGSLRVARAVGVNVGSDAGEEVGAVAGILQLRAQAEEVSPVIRQLVAE